MSSGIFEVRGAQRSTSWESWEWGMLPMLPFFFGGELFAHFLLFFFHETCFFFPGLGDVKLGMDFFAPNGDLCFWVGSRVTSAFRSEF